jgi:hypothetical protein
MINQSRSCLPDVLSGEPTPEPTPQSEPPQSEPPQSEPPQSELTSWESEPSTSEPMLSGDLSDECETQGSFIESRQ